MCNESDNNPHVDYDEEGDIVCGTATFLGVSHNSSLEVSKGE
jgi:hypothetical protein